MIAESVVTLEAQTDPAALMKLGVKAHKVSFYVGDQLIGDACPGKPEVKWSTCGYSEGTYEITARIYPFDRASRSYEPEKARASVRVLVLVVP